MCIAAPARILEINDNMATVDFGESDSRLNWTWYLMLKLINTYWSILATLLKYSLPKKPKIHWKHGMNF